MTMLLALALLGDYYVTNAGLSTNVGTKESPWDLGSSLLSKKVEPGSTVWLKGGEYKGNYEAKLKGTADKPIVVRPLPGERVTIVDSGLRIGEAAYVWIRDLEIRGSAPVEKRVTTQKGSWPGDLPGTNGLDIYGGQGCKFINLVIHDNVLGGVGWWVGSTDSELYGCLIYNNGWKGPDRDHGHGVYTQNRDGVKTIANCVVSVPAWGGSYSIHAYGSSRAWVDHYVIEDNIVYGRGPFLVGGGRPSRNIRVARNYLHQIGMQVGYTAPENEDCEVRDNVVPAGLRIDKYKKAVDEGNVRQMPPFKAVWIPNKYDPDRAHVAVYNGAKAAAVDVEVPWPSARLMDPKDVWGKPVVAGKPENGKLRVPMAGDFAAFVALKGE